MKRISTLLLSAAMLLGSVGAAQAAMDVKASGNFQFGFGWVQNMNMHRYGTANNDSNDNFYARQRIRPQINFIASEQLQGVLMFEIGTTNWGRDDARGGNNGDNIGGQLDADGVNIETKRAYLDWIVPSTDLSIRMGIQGLALPTATGFGNPVFNADVAAILASYQFNDMFAASLFWARPFDRAEVDQYRFNDADRNHRQRKVDDETDMFGLVLNVTGDGWSLTPWGVYAKVGPASGVYEYLTAGAVDLGPAQMRGSGKAVHAWWLGTAFELTMFDPLSFSMDFMYGQMGRSDALGHALGFQSFADGARAFPWQGVTGVGTRGWFLDAALDYKLDFATLGIFGWYGSGDTVSGLNNGWLGRLPVVGIDGGFAPTSFGTPGSAGVLADGLISNAGVGTWGIGLKVADMSFVEDLTHTLRVAYYRGTNESAIVTDGYRRQAHNNVNAPFNREKGARTAAHVIMDGSNFYLTDKDYAWEVNFDHKYQIYENLAAYVELGYINLNLNERVWKYSNAGGNAARDHKNYADTSDAWKAQVLFEYSF